MNKYYKMKEILGIISVSAFLYFLDISLIWLKNTDETLEFFFEKQSYGWLFPKTEIL